MLIDLGASLPDSDSPVQDDELVSKVFDGRPAAGLLFTHPHGDHYGLYKKVLEAVPMYIGPMAKELLKVLVSRLDFISREKGLPAVERMRTYQAGKELGAFQNIQVLPLYVDHSAPDAYMFYIQAAGKKILWDAPAAGQAVSINVTGAGRSMRIFPAVTAHENGMNKAELYREIFPASPTAPASGSTSKAPDLPMPMWSQRWRTVSVRS